MSYFVYEMTVKSSMIQTHILSTALHLKWFISVEILGRKSGILQSEQYALMTILWPAELRLSLSKAEFLFPNRFHLVAVFRLQHELFLSFIDGKFINVSDNCKLYFRKHPLGSEKYLVFHGLHFHWFALFLILTPLEYRKRHLQLKPQLKNMQIRKTEKDVCKGNAYSNGQKFDPSLWDSSRKWWHIPLSTVTYQLFLFSFHYKCLKYTHIMFPSYFASKF